LLDQFEKGHLLCLCGFFVLAFAHLFDLGFQVVHFALQTLVFCGLFGRRGGIFGQRQVSLGFGTKVRKAHAELGDMSVRQPNNPEIPDSCEAQQDADKVDTQRLRAEAVKLAGILYGLVECGDPDPNTLYIEDQPDGDPFVSRAATLLHQLAQAQPDPAMAEPARYQRLSGWTLGGIESLCISLDIQQEQTGGGSKSCAVAASILRGIAEQHFADPAMAGDEWKAIALDAIRRMRAAHVGCMDIIKQAEALLESEPSRRVQPASGEDAGMIAERLEYVLAHTAFINWTNNGDDVVCQLLTQDEDENYIYLSGDGVFFATTDQAIDAAMQQESQP